MNCTTVWQSAMATALRNLKLFYMHASPGHVPSDLTGDEPSLFYHCAVHRSGGDRITWCIEYFPNLQQINQTASVWRQSYQPLYGTSRSLLWSPCNWTELCAPLWPTQRQQAEALDLQLLCRICRILFHHQKLPYSSPAVNAVNRTRRPSSRCSDSPQPTCSVPCPAMRDM